MATTGTIIAGEVDVAGNVLLTIDYSDGTSHLTAYVPSDIAGPQDQLVQKWAAAIIAFGQPFVDVLARMTLANVYTAGGTANPIEQFYGAAVDVPAPAAPGKP